MSVSPDWKGRGLGYINMQSRHNCEPCPLICATLKNFFGVHRLWHSRLGNKDSKRGKIDSFWLIAMKPFVSHHAGGSHSGCSGFVTFCVFFQDHPA